MTQFISCKGGVGTGGPCSAEDGSGAFEEEGGKLGMELVPEEGLVGGWVGHSGFVGGEAGGYAGVKVGGDSVGKVWVGV